MRRTILPLLLIATVAATAAAGQPTNPTIEGPQKVKAGEPAWFWIDGVDAKSTAAIFPRPYLTVGPPHLEDGHALFWTDKPGTYTIDVMVSVIDWEAKTQRLIPLSKTVEVTGEEEPGPDPPPPPPPEPGRRWVILIEESSQRQSHPGLAELISSPSWQKYLGSKGHHWRCWDKDLAKGGSAPPEAKGWFRLAGDQLPCFFVVDESGKILYRGPPPNIGVAIEFLQKYGG